MNKQLKKKLLLPNKHLEVFSEKATYRILYGGRDGAKSYFLMDMALLRALSQRTKFFCAREYQNSIEDSIHSLLVQRIRQLDFKGFIVTKTSIKHENGSEFIFKGLKINPTSLKSIPIIDVCLIEEAQDISQNSLDIVIP